MWEMTISPELLNSASKKSWPVETKWLSTRDNAAAWKKGSKVARKCLFRDPLQTEKVFFPGEESGCDERKRKPFKPSLTIWFQPPPRRSTLAGPGEKHFGEELRFLAMKTELLFRRNGKALFRIWEEACCCLVFSLFADLKTRIHHVWFPFCKARNHPFWFLWRIRNREESSFALSSLPHLKHTNGQTQQLPFPSPPIFRRFSPAWVFLYSIPQGQEGER